MTKEYKKLYRSRNNRMIGGVCAGLGDFFGIDPTVIRLLFVFGMIFGYGSLAAVYFVLLLVVPEEPLSVDSPLLQESQVSPEGSIEPAPTDQEEEPSGENG